MMSSLIVMRRSSASSVPADAGHRAEVAGVRARAYASPGMRAPGTTAMVLLRGMVHAAAAIGVDRADLLARIGVTETELERDTSVATMRVALAWKIAAEL